mmetsp:Transcript_3999/g.10466  ORF Transcript_3999/g.10466 Transcript_3999/m.10466 type:complete len:103 (-) Transcript_3999:350-658(-)
MVQLEIDDEKILPNEDSKQVSGHKLHNQLVIPVFSLYIVDTYKQFLLIISYPEWREPEISDCGKVVRKNVYNQNETIALCWNEAVSHTSVGISDLVLVGKPI